MARLLGVLLFFLFPVLTLEAIPTRTFQPLKDTLQAYGILKIPAPSDHPDVPAIALLSIQEYKQTGLKHTRSFHKIVKILTTEGKDYANLQIPCFSGCHVEARTIKPSGRILNLPGKELFRNQNVSGYKSHYFLAQFAMPGVEAGDIIEYVATVDYPVPFFLEDFRFSEPYPLIKGVFSLIHPIDDSYTYARYSPPGGPVIKTSQDRTSEGPTTLLRTTFVVENTTPALEEPYAPTSRQDVPGIRLILQSRAGRTLDIFKDWIHYGDFILSRLNASPVVDPEIVRFAQKAAGNNNGIREIIQAIYLASESQIQITADTLWLAAFEFRSPMEVMRNRVASPHDFALFLAACFKSKKWSSDFVLVNSFDRAEANKGSVFPPDLDMVFLNVKTPIGEFLVDCNQNGLPPLQLSSSGMNRFALVIPLFLGTSKISIARSYTSTTPYREGNRNHMEMEVTPSADFWNLQFRWTLAGEFQSEWVRIHRQMNDSELRKKLIQRLRSHMDAFDFRDVQYSFTGSGLEVRGKASIRRNQFDRKAEMFQNEIWDSGFHLRPHILENRINRLVLPNSGVISSILRVHSGNSNVVLPPAARIDCPPVDYSLSFEKRDEEIIVEEKLSIRDLEIKPSSFSQNLRIFYSSITKNVSGRFY